MDWCGPTSFVVASLNVTCFAGLFVASYPVICEWDGDRVAAITRSAIMVAVAWSCGLIASLISGASGMWGCE